VRSAPEPDDGGGAGEVGGIKARAATVRGNGRAQDATLSTD